MTTATTKQANRALAIVAVAEQLRSGLNALQAIAYQQSLDGGVLTGVDTTTILASGGSAVLSTPTLGYTTGAALDQLVAASAQIAAFVGETNVTGTSTSFGAAIAAVCSS